MNEVISTGGYPIGADNDPNAPYNESLDVQHKVEVSISLSYATSVYGPNNMSGGVIRNKVREELVSSLMSNFPKDTIIDDIEIFE